MKEFFKNYPMWFNYMISILFDIILFIMIICQIGFHFSIDSILYFIGSLLYYLCYLGGWITSKLEKRSPGLNYGVAFISSSIKYSYFSILFIEYILPYTIVNGVSSINISVVTSVLVLCSAYFILTKSVFVVTGLSPLSTMMIVLIPVVIFMSVGVERGLINWTFLSLLLLSIGLQFFKKDVRYLLDSNIQKSKIPEGQIEKKKYQFLSYIPILYISLLFSEKIVLSPQFLFFSIIFIITRQV